MKRVLATVVLIVLCLSLFGCGVDYTKEGTISNDQQLAASYIEKIPGKLYFIPHTVNEADFPKYYAAFLKAYPNLKIVGFTEVADESRNNRALGYFILTESK